MMYADFYYENIKNEDLITELSKSPRTAQLIQLGNEITNKLNLKFNGVWQPTDYMAFTDIKKGTGGTIVARDYEEALQNYNELLKRFNKEPIK